MMRPQRPPSLPDETMASPSSPDDADDRRRLGPSAPPLDPGSPVRRRLLQFVERQTGQRFGDDLDRWRAWIWSRRDDPHPDYPSFKRALYGEIDPRMRAFFPDGVKSEIRLDQI